MGINRGEKLLFTSRRLANPNLSHEERYDIARKALFNELLWLRRDVKAAILQMEGLQESKKELLMLSMLYDLDANPQMKHEINNCWESVNRAIQCYQELMIFYGDRAFTVLEWLEKLGASLHDLAQVVGANAATVKKAYTELVDCRTRRRISKEQSVFAALVYVHNIELPTIRKKSNAIRARDMPLGTAIEEYLSNYLDTSPEIDKVTNEILFKHFPDLMDNLFIQRPDGTMEKYYPKPVLLQ